jgi:hypothetical protein
MQKGNPGRFVRASEALFIHAGCHFAGSEFDEPEGRPHDRTACRLESAAMILHILLTVLFLGFVLLIGVLTVMRGLYSCRICVPPLIMSDSGANASLDEVDEQSHLIRVTGALSLTSVDRVTHT